MDLPFVAPICQTQKQPAVADGPGEVRRQWLGSSLPKRLKPGARVAVGVGSRGIANIFAIVKTSIDTLKEMGFKPFVVAAMGSHGGATAEGQCELLAEYRITERELGVEVRTEMETVKLGTNSWGEPVFWDRNAFEADGAVTVSRIKPHTDFRGSFESGIMKMTVIGLGKRDGAAQHHRWGLRGLRDMMPETAKVILDKTRFLGGLAILENASEQTSHLQFVDREDLFEIEPKLLDQSRALMGRIPFEQLDVLIIGEIGKNYSGAGIDPNVIGRLMVETAPEFESPRITRIAALDLSPESHGNGTGCGLADICTSRLLKAIDSKPFRMNNLTAYFLRRSQLRFDVESDRECLEQCLLTCWQPDVSKVRLALIPNTLEVAELWVSTPLMDEVRGNPILAIDGDLHSLPFD